MAGKRSGGLPIIRASEVGAYVYCRRAWWLKRVAGFEPRDREAAFDQGHLAHARHGRQVRRAHWQRRAALVLFLAGLILIGLALWLLH